MRSSQVDEEARKSAAYRESYLAAELSIGDLKSGVAELERRLLAGQLHNQAARTSFAGENQRWKLRSERAEAELMRTSGS
jgi:hypothetical protein